MVEAIEKIISSGQAGPDRAALDAAVQHDFPHSGWCPHGLNAEDGPIGGQYHLVETPTSDAIQRTEWNVRDSDGTVVFTLFGRLAGGSLHTLEFAQRHGRPCLHLARMSGTYEDPSLVLQRFVDGSRIKVLNVAGSRESEEPGIYLWALGVLNDAFFWIDDHPGELGGPGEG